MIANANTPEPSRRAPTISLAELIALSDEMAALARAGVPLERGLLNLGEDIPGRLGRVAKNLAERMARGESLSHALSAEEGSLPRVYRTVVEAGLRSGRLSLALEGLASVARRLAEMRRIVSQAMLYPLLVVLLAYGLFVLFLMKVAPQLQAGFDSFRVPRHPLLTWLVGLGESVDTWGPIVPVVIILVAAVWWWRSGRAILVTAGYSGMMLGWFPWVGAMLRWSRGAMFAETFALLLEHDVPLDEAVLLAAEAAGDARAVEAARQMSQAIRRGEPAAVRVAGMSPIMAWLIDCRPEQRVLLSAARNAAQSYSWWANHRAEVVRMLLPILLVTATAGLVTAFYAAALFVPWSNLLRSIE